MAFSPFDVLCISTVLLLVLFGLAVASSDRRGLASNRVLLALLSLNVLLLVRAVLMMQGVLRSADAGLFIVGLGGFFALPPLVYLYVTRLLDPAPRFSRRTLIHALPAVLGVILLAGLYVARRTLLGDPAVWTLPFAVTYMSAVNIVFAGYVLATTRRLRAARTPVAAAHARWKWSASVASLFGTHWLFSASAGVLSLLGVPFDIVLALEAFSVVLLLVFSGAATVASLRRLPALRAPGYKVSSEVELGELAERLDTHMHTARPHLDPSLTMERLAAGLGVSVRDLSQTLNGVLGASFFDFVNGYRVDEAKRLLRDPARRDDTILAVLYDAGFNSKSAFNRVFKLRTGLTPSAYRRGTATGAATSADGWSASESDRSTSKAA